MRLAHNAAEDPWAEFEPVRTVEASTVRIALAPETLSKSGQKVYC